jgi:serine/threonine protein phosphatase PrpC
MERRKSIYAAEEDAADSKAARSRERQLFGWSEASIKRVAQDLCEYAVSAQKRSMDNVTVVIVFLAVDRETKTKTK